MGSGRGRSRVRGALAAGLYTGAEIGRFVALTVAPRLSARCGGTTDVADGVADEAPDKPLMMGATGRERFWCHGIDTYTSLCVLCVDSYLSDIEL